MSDIDDLIDFIQVAHAGQVDKGADAPYWQHPVAVMRTLPPFASEDLKKSALLHDSVEDTAFKPEGDRLVFDEDKFAALDDAMKVAKRPAEIALARKRGEADPENTPPILTSPPLNGHILSVVEGVTNDDFMPPAELSREEAGKLVLAHYQDHIIELANDRPSDPEALRVAEDRVLLKFTDMSQNVNKQRLSAISDKARVAWFAEKYERPFNALLKRVKEIAAKHGYELHAETVLEDDGHGNKSFYLAQPPQWIKRETVIMSTPYQIPIMPVVEAAKEAGTAILQHLTADLVVDNKHDASPVTAADKEANAIIKRHLQAIAPGIPILSEEDTPEERASATASNVKWVIDPLDGTKTAIDYANGHKDYDQFGVHIALAKDNSPVLGVAFFPAMADGKGVAYFTGDDGKAYKQTGDAAPKSIQVSKPPFKANGLRAAVHFHEARRPHQIAGRDYVHVPGVGGQRLCLVAEGSADVADMNDIPETHRGQYAYKQWDLAASHAVLKAAGGELVNAETQQPVLYDHPEFKMAGSVAGGRETLNLLGLAQLPSKGRLIT